jgi:hypothetical protein
MCTRGSNRAFLGGPSTSPLDGTVVPLLDDIAGQIQQIQQSFTGSDRAAATVLLLNARIHDGSSAGPRLQRCALVASQGSLERLQHYVKLLEVDSRDVIVAGEYESVAGELVRVRDLSCSFGVSV